MPATTPKYGIPYPLPADPVADYPGVGLNLANVLESLIGAGAHLLWDSIAAGVTLPAVSVATPTLPLDFRSLLIAWHGRSDRNAQLTDPLALRLAGNSGAVYYDQQLTANGTTVVASSVQASTQSRAGLLGGALARAGWLGSGLILLSNYSRPDNSKSYVAVGHQAGDVAAGQSTIGIYGGIFSGWTGVVQTVALLSGAGWNLQPGFAMRVWGL